MSGAAERDPAPRKAQAELVDGDGQPMKRRFTWRWAGFLVVRLAMDVALVDAAWETWASGSPARLWVAGPVALYLALTVWALRIGARLAEPGIVTQTAAPFYVFLGVLCGLTQDPAGFAAGVVFLKQPMPVVLAGTAGLVSALAALRFVTPRGTAWWLRVVFVAVGGYAAWAFGLGALRATPFPELLNGHGEWARLPRALQGPVVGVLMLTPLAFARELIVSMQTLTFKGHLGWMTVFGLMAWIAFSA